MKNFNLLRKSERKSVGTTLALTVGSPSVFKAKTLCFHAAVFAWQLECVGSGCYLCV